MLGFCPLCSAPLNSIPAAALDAVVGAYTLSGQSVVLRATRMLGIGTGSYTLTGIDVRLAYQMDYTKGLYIVLYGTQDTSFDLDAVDGTSIRMFGHYDTNFELDGIFQTETRLVR